MAGAYPTKKWTAHGLSGTPEYKAWENMISRCRATRGKTFEWYGARGIIVCPRWAASFLNFLWDVGRRPGPGYSLDRYPDQDGNYEPGNIRWATTKQQVMNSRRSKIVTFNGVHDTIRGWSVRTGIHHATLVYRLKIGWSVERALTEPLHRRYAKEPSTTK